MKARFIYRTPDKGNIQLTLSKCLHECRRGFCRKVYNGGRFRVTNALYKFRQPGKGDKLNNAGPDDGVGLPTENQLALPLIR